MHVSAGEAVYLGLFILFVGAVVVLGLLVQPHTRY